MKFYRYDAKQYASMDAGDGLSYSASNTTLFITEFTLHKETPKGYWIGYGNLLPNQKLRSESKWISKTSKKKLAYLTKKEALHSFICRKKRQRGILRENLKECESALELGLALQKKNENAHSNSARD